MRTPTACRTAKSLVPSTLLGILVCFTGFFVPNAAAQDGKLKVHASPPQAYVFVDGQAMHESSRGAFNLSVGNHTVDIYNYGYKPVERTVSITAGQTSTLDVTLDAVGGNVSGPWGCITIEGPPRAAVLLDGKTKDFFVGHIDEFNHNWWWKQELVVPPGKHLLTVLAGDKEVWSGTVDVPANQRVVVDIPTGVRKTVAWPRGDTLKSIPRFHAGIASATVAVATPAAQLSASNTQLNCGDSTDLKWTTTDAVSANISGMGDVPASGDKSVQLCQNTSYTLTASGPGGTATSTVSINVNTAIQANLTANPVEVQYHRIGDQVAQQPTATLTWTTSNASSISVDALGTVDPSGSRTVTITPRQTTAGPLDETENYTLKASNASGTTETRTASVHVTGSIEPAPEIKALETRLTLRSIFFPTALPQAEALDAGLVASQQDTLTALASDFKTYLKYKPDAHLVLTGHADPRGSAAYNQGLSERRVAVAKKFLVDQGIPDANIDTKGLGSTQALTAPEVKDLVNQDSDLTAAQRKQILTNMSVIVLAQSRRVDISLSGTSQISARQFPFNAGDATTLLATKGVHTAKKKKPAPKQQ